MREYHAFRDAAVFNTITLIVVHVQRNRAHRFIIEEREIRFSKEFLCAIKDD